MLLKTKSGRHKKKSMENSLFIAKSLRRAYSLPLIHVPFQGEYTHLFVQSTRLNDKYLLI